VWSAIPLIPIPTAPALALRAALTDYTGITRSQSLRVLDLIIDNSIKYTANDSGITLSHGSLEITLFELVVPSLNFTVPEPFKTLKYVIDQLQLINEFKKARIKLEKFREPIDVNVLYWCRTDCL
jgi:hypothetical protein